MRAVLLIAGNFAREQRLICILLVAYALVTSLFFGLFHDTTLDDMAFVLKQQAIYAIIFSGFLAVSAIHNERKSRRMLSVLSKAVTRAQYIAGLLAGAQAIIWLYCFVIWAGGLWMLRGRGSAAQLSIMMLVALVTALLTAAVALFFASFLPPIVATAATGVLIILPVALARALAPIWLDSLPVYTLGAMITENSIALSWHPSWTLILIAVLEAAGFWLLAAMIFSTRDVAVAVE
ncbi:MAG: hypothetical protein LAN37_01550 [Acidobacteriia bacterium]|nr:hypothetical protein [Terriglobia bacterium]